MDNFKLASESSSSILSEARVTMESLVALRDTTQIRLRGSFYRSSLILSRALRFHPDLESMFDNDGRFIFTAESRETVNELRSQLSKSRLAVSRGRVALTLVFAAQQVADLLRDKLHSMGTELAEARARVLELEELITADRKHCGSTAAQIRQSGTRASSLYKQNFDCDREAEQVAQVTRYLEEQKRESMQAAKKAYEMEQQLTQAQTR